jgi:ABC-type transport system substrate-binding protein
MSEKDPNGITWIPTELNRRQYLALTGALTAPAVAGCTSEDGTDQQTTSTPTESDETEGEDETTTESTSQDGGTLRVTVGSAIKNLDPAFTNLIVAIAVQNRIAEGLFKLDSNLNVVGNLAENVEYSDDGLTLTISLQEGVMFHEPFKREMVADDVVYNFDRISDPDTGSASQSDLQGVESWTAIDDYTLELELAEPDASLTATLTNNGLSILSPEALEEHGDARNNLVGTGPFAFEEWVTRDHITLVKNEDYWREGVPRVDEVIFRPISEPSVKITELQEGNIDIVQRTPVDFIPSLQDDDSVTVGIKAAGSYRNVHINSATADESTAEGRNPNTPTADRRIRQAINYAIDRQATVEIIEGGYGTVTEEFYPEDNPWHTGYAPFGVEADTERAMELIDEAGWDTPVEVHIISASDNQKLKQQGLILQDQLGNAGFDPQLHEFEIGTWVDKFFAHQYDLCVNGFPYYADPAQLQRFYKKDELETQPYERASNNYHEDVHDLWDELTVETDTDARIEIWNELQQLFIDDAVNPILYHTNVINSWRNSVQNFTQHASNTEILVEEVTLDR